MKNQKFVLNLILIVFCLSFSHCLAPEKGENFGEFIEVIFY
jgi:hypothetical protein